MTLRAVFTSGAIVASLALLAACGAGGPPVASVAGPPRLQVHDAWIREPMGGMTAGYLVIENPTRDADVLEGVTIPAGGTVTLHKTTTDASGMSGMSPVDGIHVPGDSRVTLEPGGFHLMIDGLSAKAGDKVELRLQFGRAGTITVEAEVRAG